MSGSEQSPVRVCTPGQRSPPRRPPRKCARTAPMSADPRQEGAGSFPPTRWTLIRSARASPEARRAALESLLRTYWRPLYVFMRRQGLDEEAARDAVQDLLVRLLEHEFLERLSPEKGRLRGYLLTAARNHLVHRHERESA